MAFFGIIAREAFFINSHRMVGGAVKIGLFFDKWQLMCSRLWNFKFYVAKLFGSFCLLGLFFLQKVFEIELIRSKY